MGDGPCRAPILAVHKMCWTCRRGAFRIFFCLFEQHFGQAELFDGFSDPQFREAGCR